MTHGATNAGPAEPDLAAAADALAAGAAAIARATDHAAGLGDADAHQCFLYDLAHAASAMQICGSLLDWGAKGDAEAQLACGFIADALGEFNTRLFAREAEWGLEPGALDATRGFVAAYRNPSYVATLADVAAPSHLDEDLSWWPRHSAASARTKSLPLPNTSTAATPTFPKS